MSSFKTPLLIVGILALLIGIVWVGQGTGTFPYPRQSFMIDQMPWAWRGGVLGMVGVIAVIVSRRM
jgi:uncharacterized membrane protein YdcZ (DUF606 family)